MSELRDLYQEVILDHGRRPRNFAVLATANRKADGYNPLCGDRFTVFLEVENGIVKNATFQGAGCAISTASASLMTEIVKGRTEAEAEALFHTFHAMVAPSAAVPTDQPKVELGKLAVFAGVTEYPTRVKCATLAWHTLHSAIANTGETISTE
ncbi:MAG: SUF system NifU family Fe-S cluster assembly protein [bacterium]